MAHRYVEPAIRGGVADGTVSSEYPRETAEVMLLLASTLWMVPALPPASPTRRSSRRRAAVLVRVMHALGVDLVDWESFDPRAHVGRLLGRARPRPGGGRARPSDGDDSPQ